MRQWKSIAILYVFIILILLPAYKISAQPDTSKNTEFNTNLINTLPTEKILENSQTDVEDSKLLDILNDLEENPYDLNTVSQKELEIIPYINPIAAKKIIEYRENNGKFKSKRELLKVEGITNELYEDIKLYLVVKKSKQDLHIKDIDNEKKEPVKKKFTSENPGFRLRSRFQQELQPKAGYSNGAYPGSRAKIYNSLNSKYYSEDYTVEGGITIEKDAGEKSFADFSSAHLKLSNYKFIKEAIIGDYSLNFGQGLGMWSSLSYSKGSVSVDPIKKKSEGIESYNSVNEIQFFRGAATHINLTKYNFFIFYSDNYLDASIDTTLDEASSVYYDGYHRTASELSRNNSLKERMFGGRIFYDNDNIRLGLTYWDSKFSKPFKVDSTAQYFNFSGDYANMKSFDYDLIFKNMNFYGEVASSHSGSLAGISNVQIVFSEIANMVFSYRNYSKDFTPLHSFGFGERSGNTQNETGFYVGIQSRPIKGLSVNAYYDIFKIPYRTYTDPVPTSGNDFLTYADYHLMKNFSIDLKYKNENKEETRTIKDIFNRDIKVIDTRNQINIRTGFEYHISENFRIRSRFEYIYVGYKYFGGDNKGFLFYSDVKFIPLEKLTASVRIIYFQTDDYDSRIYQYEDDIRGVMSNVALYGNGTRWYLTLKYSLLNSIDLQAKYSETGMDGVKSIGSGNDLINGNINNKLNLGLEVRF